MLSHRWFIASGFITLLLSGCGGAKSSQEIAKLTKASVILITAYTEQPSTGTGFFIKGEKGVCTVLTARHVVPIGTKVQLQSNDGKPPWEAVNIQRFPNDKAIQFQPDDAKAWHNRGVALGGLKRYDEAIKSYTAPHQPQTHRLWALMGHCCQAWVSR